MKKIVIGLVSVLISFGGYAKVLKCTLDSGEVIYTDKPCESGAMREVKNLDVNVLMAFKRIPSSRTTPMEKPQYKDYKQVSFVPGWGVR